MFILLSRISCILNCCECIEIVILYYYVYDVSVIQRVHRTMPINVLSTKLISRDISILFRSRLCVSTELNFIYFPGKTANNPIRLYFNILKFSLVTEEKTMRKTAITKKQPPVKLMAKLCITEFMLYLRQTRFVHFLYQYVLQRLR